MNGLHLAAALAIAAILAGCGNDGQPAGDNVGGLNQACRALAPRCNARLACVGQICLLRSNTTTPDGGIGFQDTGTAPRSDLGVWFEDGQVDGTPSDGDAGDLDGTASDADATPCSACDPGPCEQAQCVAKQCVYVRKKAGSSCVDEDPCTFGGRCDAKGACINSDTLVCKDGSGPCGSKGGCEQVEADKSKCVATYPKLDEPCDDGNDCTAETRCVEGADGKGACEGRPKDKGVPCDDEQLCTDPDTCDGEGHCVGGSRKGFVEVAALPRLAESSGDDSWDGWRLPTQNPGKSATWVTEGRIRQIELSGKADAGGYCYTWWGTGYATIGTVLGASAAARCSIDDKLCPTSACSGKAEFDKKGNVAVCAGDRQKGKLLGPTVSKVDIAEGTELHLEVRRRYGPYDADAFSCKIRLSCEP